VSHSTHSKTAAVTNADVLADAKALSEKITALVGAPPALTKTDVSRSAKLRKGGAAVVQTLAALSDKVGLVVPSQPTAPLVEKVNQAQSLVALHQELVTATKHVADTMFLAQSQSWAGATVHYSMLRRLGKTDGSVSKALEPVTQFFAARSASVKEEAKTKRGGARKGSAEAKANLAAKRAEEAQAPEASNAPTATGAPSSPPATTTPSNGAAH
jgi:hypothetical protein